MGNIHNVYGMGIHHERKYGQSAAGCPLNAASTASNCFADYGKLAAEQTGFVKTGMGCR